MVLASTHRVELSPNMEAFLQFLRYGQFALPTDKSPVTELIAWLRRNKYPLLALSHTLPGWLRESSEFVEALCEERTWYDTQRGEFELARLAWLEAGIECLMIKSAGNYPSFPHTSDNIDVLFRPRDAYTAREVLRAMGYVEVRNVEEPGKYLFRRFRGGRCVSAIHVHERIAWFVGFLDDEAVWDRMRVAPDDPGINVPSPEDAVLINLAHACYENKELRLVDVMRVRHSLELRGGYLDWDYMLSTARSRGWENGLAFLLLVYDWVERAMFGEGLIPPQRLAQFEAIAGSKGIIRKRLDDIRTADHLDLPLDLSYLFCKYLYYSKIASDLERSGQERLKDTLLTLIWGIKLKSRVRPQAGMVISLSGMDGAGKTVHAKALTEAFSLCELKAKYFWARGGSTGLLSLASRLKRRLGGSRTSQEADATRRRRRSLSSRWLRWGWSWAVALDQVLTYLCCAHLRARTGKIVVCDRYIYDSVVELRASLPSEDVVTRAAVAFMLHAVPRPGLGYLLDVSPQQARSRKPEEPWHSDLEVEREMYLQIARRYGLRVVASDRDFAEVNDSILQEVFFLYMSRFETWLNALFLSNPSQRNTPDPVWRRGGAR